MADSTTLADAGAGHLVAVARNGLLAWFAARACPADRGVRTFTGTPAGCAGAAVPARGGLALASGATGKLRPSWATATTAATMPNLHRTPASRLNKDTIHPPERRGPERGQRATAKQETV